MENLEELTEQEVQEIEGGWIQAVVLGLAVSTAFHVAKEAYNDWDAHVAAFNEGMNAA